MNQSTSGSGKGGFPVQMLISTVADATQKARDKLEAIRSQGDNVNVTDMFEMQFEMGDLNTLTEMSTSIVSALFASIQKIAMHVKGG